MKRTTFFIVLFMAIPLIANADQHAIALEKKNVPRDGFPIYVDIPAAYYCDDDKSQWILIDGGGAVSYYDVEISVPVTNYVEISTQVDGTYDTFDISSLSPGLHVITIESPSGNIYEGTFTTY